MPRGRPKKIIQQDKNSTLTFIPEGKLENISRKEMLVSLLKLKVPRLFDRDPQSYSSERLNNLADEIICLLEK